MVRGTLPRYTGEGDFRPVYGAEPDRVFRTCNSRFCDEGCRGTALPARPERSDQSEAIRNYRD